MNFALINIALISFSLVGCYKAESNSCSKETEIANALAMAHQDYVQKNYFPGGYLNVEQVLGYSKGYEPDLLNNQTTKLRCNSLFNFMKNSDGSYNVIVQTAGQCLSNTITVKRSINLYINGGYIEIPLENPVQNRILQIQAEAKKLNLKPEILKELINSIEQKSLFSFYDNPTQSIGNKTVGVMNIPFTPEDISKLGEQTNWCLRQQVGGNCLDFPDLEFRTYKIPANQSKYLVMILDGIISQQNQKQANSKISSNLKKQLQIFKDTYAQAESLLNSYANIQTIGALYDCDYSKILCAESSNLLTFVQKNVVQLNSPYAALVTKADVDAQLDILQVKLRQMVKDIMQAEKEILKEISTAPALNIQIASNFYLQEPNNLMQVDFLTVNWPLRADNFIGKALLSKLKELSLQSDSVKFVIENSNSADKKGNLNSGNNFILIDNYYPFLLLRSNYFESSGAAIVALPTPRQAQPSGSSVGSAGSSGAQVPSVKNNGC